MGKPRVITEDDIMDSLHELLPEADEISLSYFKSNGHWSMWAAREILVDKPDGQRIKERIIFAREDGETPLHCIEKHISNQAKHK